MWGITDEPRIGVVVGGTGFDCHPFASGSWLFMHNGQVGDFGCLRRELEDNFRAVLRANLERWDLVSRERFDVQAEVLARTQKRLRELEARLAALEQQQKAGG